MKPSDLRKRMHRAETEAAEASKRALELQDENDTLRAALNAVANYLSRGAGEVRDVDPCATPAELAREIERHFRSGGTN